ncbi:MAG: hypothetical protein JHC95_16085 [Solirubrobacteraceae bacterium]|nr:hypothetical protein [Solirubrobacteraceae bacterium]
MTRPTELANGLWRWTARHPEWHPQGFGDEVACCAARAAGGLVLIDPLVPEDGDALLAWIDEKARAASEVWIYVTLGYHERSAELLAERLDATIWSNAHRTKQAFTKSSRFRDATPGEPLPWGGRAMAIGKPRRQEQPLFLPEHETLVFGDAFAAPDGELRMWSDDQPVDDRVRAFYRDRFAPSCAALLELSVERVIVGHGEPIVRDGHGSLARALAAEPWHHR